MSLGACPGTQERNDTSEYLASDPAVGTAIAGYFAPFVANRDFSGVVRVERKGELVFEGAWGTANLDSGVEVTPRTPFGIASVTKSFTAHALVVLRGRGLVDFEAPLSDYFPDFAHGEAIRVKHLLRFESGLPELEGLVGPDRNVPRDEIIRILSDAELLFPPGSSKAYSNAGFTVAALLIEKVSGRSFESFLRREFLEVLGIEATGDHNAPDSRLRGLARPYLPGPPPSLLRPGSGGNASQSLGAGSMYSTAPDLCRWGLAVARDRFVDLDAEDWPWG